MSLAGPHTGCLGLLHYCVRVCRVALRTTARQGTQQGAGVEPPPAGKQAPSRSQTLHIHGFQFISLLSSCTNSSTDHMFRWASRIPRKTDETQ